MKINIIALSDLHGYLPKIEGCYDIMLIAGDIIPLEFQRNYEFSLKWLFREMYSWCDDLINRGIVKDIVYIPGNHDFCFEDALNDYKWDPTVWMSEHHIYLLIDSSIEINGIKIWGSPWCPELKKWAFYKRSDKLIKYFNYIPDDTDILITHTPPKIEDFGKVLQQNIFNSDENYGCFELAEVIKNKNIKLNVFGHVHSGQHQRKIIDGTMFANVSILNENYEKYYDPQVFEYDTETKTIK